ncbi:hypothetical protein KORDIASMS9_01482 [Kordia sp. SMS9]|uniref:DUF5908 family protein n=1 Tax=Kordia sp. SMS9 TaxID=2282170 RepID=UPI000E101586|nr:DUF5908 family protein [Kordia sp. SMS9]AXG69262.1 hypothetical protein KORDIASMS9_01482 [Kordia sp. SMS9]
MPIEIRELVIKTEIKTVHENLHSKRSAYDTSQLKNEVLESCRRMITEAQKREKYNR